MNIRITLDMNNIYLCHKRFTKIYVMLQVVATTIYWATKLFRIDLGIF